MKYHNALKIIVILVICSASVYAQTPLDQYEPYNPTVMRSRIALDTDAYYFVASTYLYGIRPSYFFGLPNNKHTMGITVPFIHSIFAGDFGGYENTTGIGDIKFTYYGVPFQSEDLLGFNRLTFALEVTAPTGNEQVGRGTGAWVYKPALVANIRPIPNAFFFPQINFQFSTSPLNSLGGGDGLPDPEDTDLERQLQVLGASFPFTLTIEQAEAWFTLSADYLYSFSESTSFLFIRMDVGKMLGKNTSGGLQISKFVAGQPRLETLVRARFNFFLGR